MIEAVLGGVLENMPDEMKSGLRKIKEFFPLIEAYHNGIKLEPGEIKVSYLAMIEQGNIMLYQVVIAKDEGRKLPVISRTLQKWNITEKLNEITGEEAAQIE